MENDYDEKKIEGNGSPYPKEYRDAVDELNRRCREQLGFTKDAFTYLGGVNTNELSDDEVFKIPDEILHKDAELMYKYKL